MGQVNGEPFAAVRVWPAHLEAPLSWKKPRRSFVNSMSDLFHDDLPLDGLREIFRAVEAASHHTFQVLTKRAERLQQLAGRLPWPQNLHDHRNGSSP